MARDQPSNGESLPPKDVSVSAKQQDVDEKKEPSVEPKAEIEYVHGVKLFIICATVAFASFLMLLDNMIVSTAIPRITNEFHSLADVGWYASAYQFGSAAPQPLTGRIYKYFNTKWTFLVFFAIFEIGSIICGAAISSPMFIVGRFIAGFGGAGIATGSITIISLCAPLEKRPLLIGLNLGFNLLGLGHVAHWSCVWLLSTESVGSNPAVAAETFFGNFPLDTAAANRGLPTRDPLSQ